MDLFCAIQGCDIPLIIAVDPATTLAAARGYFLATIWLLTIVLPIGILTILITGDGHHGPNT